MSLKARLKLRYKKEKNLGKNSDHSHGLILRSGHCVSWRSRIRSTWKHSLPKDTNAMLGAVRSSVLDAGY